MNLAGLQALGGMNLQPTSSSGQAGSVSGNTFGSVFSGMTANSVLGTTIQTEAETAVTDESILAIFEATSLEELLGTLKTSTEIDGTQLGGLKELTESLNVDPEKAMESLLSLLKQAGISEEELTEITTTNDIWLVMNVIEKVAPQFFKGLSEALEGKGDVSKQQAVDLLTLLKGIQLAAPKTDLVMKQEQQVFTLQSYLTSVGENFEQAVQTVKPKMLHLLESVKAGKLVLQSDAKNEDKIVNTVVTTTATTTTVTSLLEESEVDGKQTTQQIVGTISTTQTPLKPEVSQAELENRANARNEALIKDMQAIFKRSSFGQVGGTNRLLIKLYPEHLGQVRIELVQTNGIMTARILASTALGKEMLDSQLNQLRNAFVQQNVQVDRIDVSQTLQDTSRNDKDQAFNQHFKQQQQEQSNETNDQLEEKELTFQEFMIELEA